MSGGAGTPADSVRGTGDGSRDAELAGRLATVRRRIVDACASAGRDPAEITLVAVTKTHPVDDVARLVDLGVCDIGENHDQEAASKAAVLAEAGLRVRWHFVGRLQRNKCRSVVRYADLVHSVDSVRLAVRLGQEAGQRRDRPLDVLVQLSLDQDPSRGGASRGAVVADRDVDRAVEAVLASDALRLRGVMAVVPLAGNAPSAFAQLSDLAAEVRSAAPGANIVSAGMSEDLERAIAHGTTHVRIGRALLGKRAPVG